MKPPSAFLPLSFALILYILPAPTARFRLFPSHFVWSSVMVAEGACHPPLVYPYSDPFLFLNYDGGHVLPLITLSKVLRCTLDGRGDTTTGSRCTHTEMRVETEPGRQVRRTASGSPVLRDRMNTVENRGEVGGVVQERLELFDRFLLRQSEEELVLDLFAMQKLSSALDGLIARRNPKGRLTFMTALSGSSLISGMFPSIMSATRLMSKLAFLRRVVKPV